MSFEKFATMRDQAVVGKEDIDFSQLSLPVFEPLPENHNTEVPDGWKQAREQGEKMIQEGKVALLTIAG